ncbi:hypothetical protein F2P81_015786 [Scophthalmus maximus]|uniref:Uncharacterized protein n=1 Tax=Scophthalmus maximus TaxID=52904 RepID=A0A6A4SJC6_SCOMX|nr:hypothetical protein F2P81_015786 [Scophthalmus maximus]
MNYPALICHYHAEARAVVRDAVANCSDSFYVYYITMQLCQHQLFRQTLRHDRIKQECERRHRSPALDSPCFVLRNYDEDHIGYSDECKMSHVMKDSPWGAMWTE